MGLALPVLLEISGVSAQRIHSEKSVAWSPHRNAKRFLREGSLHSFPSLLTNEGLDATWLQIIRAMENRDGETVLLNCSALRYHSDVKSLTLFPGKSRSGVGLSPASSVVKADMKNHLDS